VRRLASATERQWARADTGSDSSNSRGRATRTFPNLASCAPVLSSLSVPAGATGGPDYALERCKCSMQHRPCASARPLRQPATASEPEQMHATCAWAN
jgi:hypothetical protein